MKALIRFRYVLILLIMQMHVGCDPDETQMIDPPYILQVPSHFPKPLIPSDNPLTVNKVKLGRMLFYDPILSIDSSLSCSSCHIQKFAFGTDRKLDINASHGSTTRNSSVLFNLAFTDQFFWDGRTQTLESTCDDALRNELNFELSRVKERLLKRKSYRDLFTLVYGAEPYTTENINKALASFIRTLISGNSKVDRGVQEGNAKKYLTPMEVSGLNLFTTETADCFHCHGDPVGNPLMTDSRFRNNGLDHASSPSDFLDKGLGLVTSNPNDNGKFKTAALRNLKYSAPYMHDGRFATLDEVLHHYSTGVKDNSFTDPLMKFKANGGVRLNAQQTAELKAFLSAMDDESFINDTRHSNPF